MIINRNVINFFYISEIRKQTNALINLSKKTDLYVCKFDEGNGVFIDNRSRYIEKIQNILSDKNKFRLYKKSAQAKNDPFIVEQDKFNRKIKELFKKGKITNEMEDKFRAVGSQPARLYGLSKVHKNREDPPYRPVLSMPNAYCTGLSKWLDNLLKPFIIKEHTVKDTFEFCKVLKDSQLDASKSFLVSFDVKSLFTSIPVDKTIDYICNNVPIEALPIDKSTLKELLQLACQNILFSFNNKLYVQHDGMSMGSNLGPTMAAFTMDMVEKQITRWPLLYKRYVDDVFAVFKTKPQAKRFLKILNSINSNIQFTIEEESNDSLCFLDTNVFRKNGEYEIEWHLKDTNTGVYIPRNAHCPLKYKKAAIKGLIFRAYRISSSYTLFEKSFEIIKRIFIRNGYHTKFIDKVRTDVEKQLCSPKENIVKPKQLFLSLSYSKTTFKHVLPFKKSINALLPGSHRLDIAFKTRKTSSFFPNKDRVPNGIRSNVIYKFQCGQCNCSYIGETTRHLNTRIEEHVKGKSNGTEVSHHVHPPSRKNFSIITQSKKTKITESIVLSSQNKNNLLNDFNKSYPLRLFPSLS